MKRGYFGIAIYRPKNIINIGTVWRSAHILGASFFATIGQRYKRQPSDTYNSSKHVPLFEYQTFDNFKQNLPKECRLIGVELCERALLLDDCDHPHQACYLFGAEDDGLPEKILDECHHTIRLRGERSMNLAVAGSIVMYHRGLS